MDKVAKVIDTREEVAVIEVQRMSECGDKCSTCAGGCEAPMMQIQVPNTLEAKSGDFVVLKMEPAHLIQTTFVLYTVPLILFIGGIFFGLWAFGQAGMTHTDALGIATGVVGLVIGFGLVKLWSNKQEQGDDQILVMDRIVHKL